MADADVPGEGEGFGGAFDGDWADGGAVVDVFDGNELGLGVAVCLVEADGGGVVGRAEAGTVEFVAEGGGEHGVGFGVGEDVVPDAPVRFFRFGEDGAADLEGVARAEAGRRLLLDTHHAHPAADLRVAKHIVDERLDERLVVEAEEPVRAARELQSMPACAPFVEPAQRVEAQGVM